MANRRKRILADGALTLGSNDLCSEPGIPGNDVHYPLRSARMDVERMRTLRMPRL
jgi:hypothetical protein